MAINADKAFTVDQDGVALADDDGNVIGYFSTGVGDPVGSSAPINSWYFREDTQTIYYKFASGDSDWRQIRAEDIEYSGSTVASELTSLQSQIDAFGSEVGVFTETIWAEENASLGNGQREWSFGNGSTGAVNVIAMYEGRITKMFIHAESPGTTASINVMVNDAVADTGTFNANGVFTFTTPIEIAEGDEIGFQTNTVTGTWTDVRVGVALTRQITGLKGDKGDQGDPGTPGPSNHSGLTLDDGTNPHGTTQSDVGLGNVDNTSDVDKPVSTAQQAALDLKYDASNPNGYETPAQLNARDTANRARANHTGTQPASTITGLATVATSGNHSDLALDDGTNPHGTTKADVGLGNAENTSDLDKPISTATQAALDLKYDASNPNGYETPAQLDARDTANRDRSNHTGTQLASTISNFATTVLNTILSGLVIVDAVVSASDTVLSAIGKLQGQINNFTANLFYTDTAIFPGLVNNTDSLEEYATFSPSVPVAGDYRIDWTYNWSLNAGANDFIAQIRVNGVVIWDHIQEPKDAGGSGINLPNTGGGTTNTGTNQRHVICAHEVIALTAGSNDIEIYFRGSVNNDAAAIYRARMSIQKWGTS